MGMISAVDLSNVAFRIQYIPREETPQEDQADKPPAPTNLVTVTGIEKIGLAATVANLPPGDLVEFYASADNNRTNATIAGYGAQSIFIHNVPVSTTRYYWVRIRRPQPGVDSFSEFYPVSATGGVVGTSDAVATGDIDPNAATDVGSVAVNSDAYTFPSSSGTQDRTFTAFDYTNSTSGTISIEVSVSGFRRLTTPAGLSGTTDCISWISILNVTDSLLVASTQDFMSPQIEDQPANTEQSYFESTVFLVTIAAGKTYRFTPFCRVFPVVGSTGNCELDTLAYTMRVTSVKR